MESQRSLTSQDISQFVTFVGIDWADKKHDFAIMTADSDQVHRGQVEHTPEALEDWVLNLRSHFGGPVAVAVELSRGPLINALMKYEFITVFPIPPARLASYRAAFSSSGAKDDPADAWLILDYLRKHADHLQPWRPESPQTRELASLCQTRRKLVDLQTGISNTLHSTLKLYFPQIRGWLTDLKTRLACDLLERWSTLEDLQRARPNSIRKFFLDHRSRSHARIDRIIEERRTAVPLTTDTAVISASVSAVRACTGQLKSLARSIAEVEQRIKELFATHSDAHIFQSFPGAGDAMAPRLLVAMGTDRERYADAAVVQTYSGIAPIVVRSGKTTNRVQRRFACPKFLKQSFHEYADQSIRFCRWARAYYDLMRERGAKHHAAVRALAYKWIRVIYACWRDRVPYNDERYEQAIRQAGSPLVKHMDCPGSNLTENDSSSTLRP